MPLFLSPGGQQYPGHGEDVVVATGYSDAVPPNTTVYIYTTNGGMSEQLAIDETTGEHIVLEEVPQDVEENPAALKQRTDKTISPPRPPVHPSPPQPQPQTPTKTLPPTPTTILTPGCASS